MTSKKLKVLLIVEQCAPEGFSVPLEGYNYYKAIDEIADVTLVTHGRNEQNIQKQMPFYLRATSELLMLLLFWHESRTK